MTVDTWTIIGTRIALALLLVGLFAWLRSDIKELQERVLGVEKEQARTSGLLEGLALTGCATPAAGAD